MTLEEAFSHQPENLVVYVHRIDEGGPKRRFQLETARRDAGLPNAEFVRWYPNDDHKIPLLKLLGE